MARIHSDKAASADEANSGNSADSGSKDKKPSTSWLSRLLLLLGLIALGVGVYLYAASQKKDEVTVLTREGVITQIKELSRLQTVVFAVDTVITSKKEGNWYSLWQDEQKGLFVAHGRVNAGIDLNKLTPQSVEVTPIATDATGAPVVASDADLNIHVSLPAAEVFEVYLDDIDVYDLQTGLFGVMKIDPAIFEQAQASGKQEVLAMACKGEVLKMATDNAQKQVESLFKLTGATVTVDTQPPSSCVAPAH